MKLPLLTVICFFPFLYTEAFSADPPKQEKFRYLRPAGDKWETECEFVIDRNAEGWSISSSTFRGKTTLIVGASYDTKDHLRKAEITLKMGEEEAKSTIEVHQKVATVKSPNHERKEFEVSTGVVVTSAPDWTDTFLVCRRYDRAKGEKQEFPGLWVHPRQPTQQPTFTMVREGEDKVRHRDQELKLDRFRITLRPKSNYTAWTDSQGTMIRLVPLPYKAPGGLVLAGYEPIVEALKP